jgi:hypothetical protein
VLGKVLDNLRRELSHFIQWERYDTTYFDYVLLSFDILSPSHALLYLSDSAAETISDGCHSAAHRGTRLPL